MPWLEDIVAQLEADGVGTHNVDIFTSTKAKVPILASGLATITVIGTGGTTPDTTHNSVITPAYLHPAAQLTGRAASYQAAEAKARAAYASLCKVRNQFINSGWYRSIKPLQEPFDGGVDPRDQAQCQFNIIGDKRT